MFLSEEIFHQYFVNELSGIYPMSEIHAIRSIVYSKYLLLDSTSKNSWVQNLMLELKKEKPLQYILQEAYFYKYKFYVDERVLIPRPETEELVELVEKKITKNAQIKALDIGTGSGCIAISLKFINPMWNIWAMDISKDALQVAEYNSTILKAPVLFIQDDITNIKHTYPQFDVIISNPPYIPLYQASNMNNNVTQYEPNIALFVPNSDPLIYYRNIIEFCKLHLKNNGELFCEISEFLGDETKKLFETSELFLKTALIKDLNNKNRFLHAIKK